MKVFKLPDLGEGLTDAEIVAWHVTPGDHVVRDQPLVSVETDKAVVDIPAPWSGDVARLFAEPGDIVETGADLVAFDGEARSDPGAIVGTLPDTESDEKEGHEVFEQVSSKLKTGRIYASPAVRQLARERGIDLSIIHRDSLQDKDIPDLEILLNRFPQLFQILIREATQAGGVLADFDRSN